MSRSGYSDDCEYLDLYRANVERTIQGKRGQKFLVDLIQALDEMPEKKLITDQLEEAGQVCAIGALGLKRKVPMAHLDPEDQERVGKAFGISGIMAAEVVFENDERYTSQTPEERWVRMRAWAVENLR